MICDLTDAVSHTYSVYSSKLGQLQYTSASVTYILVIVLSPILLCSQVHSWQKTLHGILQDLSSGNFKAPKFHCFCFVML